MTERDLEGQPEISVQQAIEFYHDQWVLMNLAESPSDILAARGKVLYHARDYKRASKAAIYANKKRDASARAPHFFLFHAVPLATTGEEVRQVLSEAKEKGLEGGFRRW